MGRLVRAPLLAEPAARAGRVAEGGQWTSGGGVTGSVSLLSDGEQVALNIDPNVAADTGLGDLLHSVADFLVNLADEEGGAHGGHAIQEHVGKDQIYLINRIRASIWGNRFAGGGYSRAGTFPSLEAANKLINSVLAENRALVDQVIQGPPKSSAMLAKRFKSPTGFEAFTLSQMGSQRPHRFPRYVRRCRSDLEGFAAQKWLLRHHSIPLSI